MLFVLAIYVFIDRYFHLSLLLHGEGFSLMRFWFIQNRSLLYEFGIDA